MKNKSEDEPQLSETLGRLLGMDDIDGLELGLDEKEGM